MSEIDEKEIKDNQKELFQRIGGTEKFNAAQKQINLNLVQSHKHLEEKFEEKTAHLEESLSGKLLAMTEILSAKLEGIQATTSKTNGNVMRNREDISALQRNEIKLATISKDVGFLKETCGHQDIEIERLRDVVEPLKTAQRFPALVKYTVIGFLIIVVISIWGIIAIAKSAKNGIEKEYQQIEKTEQVKKPIKNN